MAGQTLASAKRLIVPGESKGTVAGSNDGVPEGLQMGQNQYGFRASTSKSDAQVVQVCDRVLLTKPAMNAPDRWRRKYTWAANAPGDGVLRSYQLRSAGVLREMVGQATVSVSGALIDVWVEGEGATRIVVVAGRAPHVNFNVNAGFVVFPKYMAILQQELQG